MNKSAKTEGGGAEQRLREKIGKRVSGAITLYKDGKKEAALDECKKIIEIDGIDGRNAAHVSKLFAKMGQAEAAAQIRDTILARLAEEAAARPEDVSIQSEAGLLHEFLDDPDTAAEFYQNALGLKPTDLTPAFQLCGLHLKRGDPEAAVQVWEPLIDHVSDPGKLWLKLARMLGQSGFREQAEEVIERARPHCGSYMKELEFVAAGIRGDSNSLDQHGMAVELFDGFADSYDQTLESLGNNGPFMIGRMLEELDLKRDQSRNVLDAGCGTGLCAEHVRPFASKVAGADISPNMLKICLEKRVYNTLTRTDLSEPVTYPEGSFDLIVAADVLVYFGDLRDIFSNIASKIIARRMVRFHCREGAAARTTGGISTACNRASRSRVGLSGPGLSGGRAWSVEASFRGCDPK